MNKLILLSFLILSLNSYSQNLYEFYLIKGSSLIVQKDYENAIYYLNKAVERYPDSAAPYYHRGGANYFLMEFDQAIYDFDKTLQLDKSYWEVYKWRGMIFHQMERYDDAEVDYISFLRFKENDLFVHVKLAEVWIKKDELGKAEKALFGMVESHPNNQYVNNALGMLFEEKKNNSKALEYYRTAVAIDESQAIFHMNVAKVLNSLDRVSEACESWKKAAKLGSPEAAQLIEEAKCYGSEEPISPR